MAFWIQKGRIKYWVDKNMRMINFLGLSEKTTKIGKILDVFAQLLDEFLLPFIIAIGVLGAAQGLYLGISYSKAEGDAKKEAQKRIINFIVGLVAVIVLIVLLEVFVANEENFIHWIEETILKREFQQVES